MATPEIEIPKHYVPTFRRTLIHALQQKGSKFLSHVTVEPGSGEGAAPVDLFGDTEAQEKTDRFGDTPIMDVTRARRWAFPKEYEWGTLIDKADKLKQVLDPTSPLMEAALRALRRAQDTQIIIPAFFGTAFEGKDVSTAVSNGVAFDTSLYSIGVQVGSNPAADTGMNVAKLQAAIKKFMELEVDLDEEKPVVAIAPKQWDDLFNEAKAINGDYINGRPLQSGDLPGLFNVAAFVITNKLTVDASGFRRCPIWVPSGISYNDWSAISIQLAHDPGKRYNVRPYANFMAGAVRTQEGRVLEIPCKEI